eukprot:GHVS01039207.1.p1 GENE.GHVS01039207.1~~GHVS01039207.1.p1  ORF type:complete len:203 (-),score=18.23 GHVS01039207.1:197-805(-)
MSSLNRFGYGRSSVAFLLLFVATFMLLCIAQSRANQSSMHNQKEYPEVEYPEMEYHLRVKDVKKFIKDFMRLSDTNIGMETDYFFGPAASLHIIEPFMSDCPRLDKGEESPNCPTLWQETHLEGSSTISRTMSGGGSWGHTDYEFVLVQPAQAASMYVIVQGTRHYKMYPAVTFVQEFLVVRDEWCPARMRIWYTTFTGGLG